MPKFDNDDNLRGPFELDDIDTDDDVSLESILAEYKGSAFIEGAKKTPAEILEEQARRIVMEASEGGLTDTELFPEPKSDKVPSEDDDFFADIRDPELDSLPQPDAAPVGTVNERPAVEPQPIVPEPDPVPEPDSWEIRDGQTTEPESEPEKPDNSAEILREAGVTDDDMLFFDSFKYADRKENYASVTDESGEAAAPGLIEKPAVDDFVLKVSSAIERETEMEETEKQDRKKLDNILHIFKNTKLMEDEYDEPDAPDPDEPDYADTAKKLVAKSRKLKYRVTGAFAISIIIAVFTMIFEKNGTAPFGIGDNIRVLTAVLLLAQLVVMLLGVDILVSGVRSFFKGGPGAEALIVFSCLVTYIASFYYIGRANITAGLPFCAVSSFSVAFSIWAEKLHLKAMADSLRTASATMHPYGIMTDYNESIDRTLVKKRPDISRGFYNNLVQADTAEVAFRYFAPILMFASLFLAVITSIGNGRGQYFLHFFSAMASASAAFSSVLAFSFPFNKTARRARKLGAAVAGWGGADALYLSDGVRVTDDDLFPSGTLSLSGVKIFEDVRPEKAIRYTASLIIASGSGLAKIFSELLSTQGLTMVRVDDFNCYEGGVGALIRGERALVGSAAFMNLMGIRVPQSLNMKNAVFTAVNDSLIAVFAVNYVPVGTVQSALISMLRSHTKLYFAVRDFNITPLMLQQKFKVPVADTEYLPVHDTYTVSGEIEHITGRAEAVLCREGLGPFAEAVTGAKRLRTVALIATIVSVASAIVGMVLMFFMCWKGEFTSASPVNLLLYMLAMLAADLIIGYTAVLRK